MRFRRSSACQATPAMTVRTIATATPTIPGGSRAAAQDVGCDDASTNYFSWAPPAPGMRNCHRPDRRARDDRRACAILRSDHEAGAREPREPRPRPWLGPRRGQGVRQSRRGERDRSESRTTVEPCVASTGALARAVPSRSGAPRPSLRGDRGVSRSVGCRRHVKSDEASTRCSARSRSTGGRERRVPGPLFAQEHERDFFRLPRGVWPREGLAPEVGIRRARLGKTAP
jgi:hypothetical protein